MRATHAHHLFGIRPASSLLGATAAPALPRAVSSSLQVRTHIATRPGCVIPVQQCVQWPITASSSSPRRLVTLSAKQPSRRLPIPSPPLAHNRFPPRANCIALHLSWPASVRTGARSLSAQAQPRPGETPPAASSESARPGGRRYVLIVSAGAAIAGVGLFLGGSRLWAAKNAGAGAGSSSGDDEDLRFAPTLEEQEAIPHPNFFLRIALAVQRFLRDWVVEPLGTAKRFLVLFGLFMPVLLTMPMLFVGSRSQGARRRDRRRTNVETGERWGALWWYGFLVRQMERAGPTFIKLAQWAGSRQDLFPNELCKRFGKLHANGDPHSLKYTKKVIERVFQRPFDEVFESFPDDPIGIGAVGQVYRATLKPNLLPLSYLEEKRERRQRSQLSERLALTYEEEHAPPAIPTASVAIKVLHPRVHRTIARDIKIMSFFAKVINLLPGAQWLSFPEEVEVFSQMMFEQLDLRNEARNLRRFEENFRKRGSSVSFPRPLFGFSTKEILIEEFEDAVPLKYFLSMGGGGFDHRIASLGLDTFLNMLLLDNFTHADLHPGNIMVKFYRPTTRSVLRGLFHRILSKFDSSYTSPSPQAEAAAVAADAAGNEDSAAGSDGVSAVHRLMNVRGQRESFLSELEKLDAQGFQPELVLIDAGLTVELSPTNRRNFLDLFGAVAEFDGAYAGHLMVERCRTPELVVDEETFMLKMQDLVLGVKSKTFSLAKIKIGDVLTQVLASVRQHHVKMEPDFTNTVISILLLEGIGRQLDPTMDLFKSALPILRSLGREMTRGGGGGAGGEGGDEGGGFASSLPGAHELRELTPMIKVWLWMEARSWISSLADTPTTNAFVKYDWLTTAL